MLKDTARDGRGVTHSMEQALELGDRTILMHRGVILADLSGEGQKRTTERDLLERFARLRHTMEYTAQMSVRSEK